MDISKIVAEPFKLDITHPTNGQKVGLTLTLLPPSDERVKATERRVNDKLISKRIRGKGLKSEEMEANGVEYLASAISAIDWSPDGSLGGEKLTFSLVNVRKLLAYDFIYKQVDEALAETSNFFRN